MALSVNKIRKLQFADPHVREVVDFLLKEVDDARESAIGYAMVGIDESIFEPDECFDIQRWRAEFEDARDDELEQLQRESP